MLFFKKKKKEKKEEKAPAEETEEDPNAEPEVPVAAPKESTGGGDLSLGKLTADVEKLKAQLKEREEELKKSKAGFKVSISSGLYYIGRDQQLSTVVGKVGYALTKGTNSIDISADNFNEVNLTEGKEIRYIAEKQGIELTMHGSLQVPMCVPDRIQWKEAEEVV